MQLARLPYVPCAMCYVFVSFLKCTCSFCAHMHTHTHAHTHTTHACTHACTHALTQHTGVDGVFGADPEQACD